MAGTFLTARWANLALLQYRTEPAALAPYLPEGLELDLYDGSPFVSLVAFDFLDTRVKGVRWPWHVNFPEVNLRFYVRDPKTGERGVSFVRELVPKRMIAWTARALYNEPYARARMSSSTTEDGASIRIEHNWTFRWVEHALTVRAGKPPTTPPEDSLEHFFKEHSRGYGRSRSGRTIRYGVEHPVWSVYTEPRAEVRVDFGSLYGETWAPLKGREPDSVVFAVGSEVRVEPLAKRG